MHMLGGRQAGWAALIYLVAALLQGLALAHVARATRNPLDHVLRNGLILLLIVGLLACAVLWPGGSNERGWLVIPLVVALLTLSHMVWLMRRSFARGSVPHLLMLAAANAGAVRRGLLVVGAARPCRWRTACGSPSPPLPRWGTETSCPPRRRQRSSRCSWCLLGFGVLSLVTAAIAASWVESDERRIEREILHGPAQATSIGAK